MREMISYGPSLDPMLTFIEGKGVRDYGAASLLSVKIASQFWTSRIGSGTSADAARNIRNRLTPFDSSSPKIAAMFG